MKKLIDNIKTVIMGVKVYSNLDIDVPTLIINDHLGEVVFFGAYLISWQEKNGVVNVIVPERLASLVKCFTNERIKLIIIGNEQCNALCRVINKFRLKRKPILNSIWKNGDTMSYAQNLIKDIEIHKEHLTDVFITDYLELEHVSKVRPPKFSDDCMKKVNTIIEENRISRNRSIIISPYAKTCAELSETFWNDIVDHLRAADFCVFTNCAGEEMPLSNTLPLKNIDIGVMPTLVAEAGYFLGIQSGLSDWMNYAADNVSVILKASDIEDRKMSFAHFCYHNGNFSVKNGYIIDFEDKESMNNIRKKIVGDIIQYFDEIRGE